MIGLGSQTQVHFIGSIGISELPIFLIAPILFLLDYKKLKHDGFLPFIWLSILTCFGCVVSSYCNHTPTVFFIKGLAFPYAIFASTVVLHRVLREDLASLKWYFLGSFLSGIICIFIFQPETFTAQGGDVAVGEEAVERVTGNVLFIGGKIREALALPVKMAYLSVPTSYSVGISVVSAAVYMLFSSGSGRSAALTILMSAVLILLAGVSRRKMAELGRHVVSLGVVGLILLAVFKSGYSFAAKRGYLGHEAQEKYFRQTRTGESALALIMAGRMELFCGGMACLDRPIIGFGPKAEDRNGYVERYLRDFAAQEDYENYIQSLIYHKSRGEALYIKIPDHSHLIMFWLYYGIVGLFLWMYVLWLFFGYLRRYSVCIPQYFGYVAMGISANLWHIFFSPFAARIDTPLLICCILFCKAIYGRRLKLPYDMEIEARKHE